MIKTIRGRITFWAVLVLILSIAAVTFANVYYLGGRLYSEQEDSLQAQSAKYAEEVNTNFMRMIGMLDGVSSSIMANGNLSEENAKRFLNGFYEENPELLNVYMATMSGNFYQANEAEMPEGYDPRKRPWYRKAVESRDTTVVNPYVDTTTGNMVVTVSKPIYINQELMGVVAIDILVDTIVEIVESVGYEEGAYGFLVDSDGNIVSHKNKIFNPTQTGLTKIGDVMPKLEEAVNSAGTRVTEMQDYNGVESYIACEKIESCGWVFGISIPTEIVKSDIVHTLGLSMVVAVVAALSALMACLVLIKKEFMPIKKMLPAIQRISSGDFSETLDFSKRDDELGALQNELSKLVEILNEIIAQEKYILGEISVGNLTVSDMDMMPGEFNDIADSVNSIKSQLNTLITEIQFSAITLQSTAMGFTGEANPEEMQALFAELSAEANDLMEKANAFKTVI